MATCEDCKRMINNLFNDRSRTLEEILEDLQGLRDEIENAIECIETDIEVKED